VVPLDHVSDHLLCRPREPRLSRDGTCEREPRASVNGHTDGVLTLDLVEDDEGLLPFAARVVEPHEETAQAHDVRNPPGFLKHELSGLHAAIDHDAEFGQAKPQPVGLLRWIECDDEPVLKRLQDVEAGGDVEPRASCDLADGFGLIEVISPRSTGFAPDS
jgi:hypothetical protein